MPANTQTLAEKILSGQAVRVTCKDGSKPEGFTIKSKLSHAFSGLPIRFYAVFPSGSSRPVEKYRMLDVETIENWADALVEL